MKDGARMARAFRTFLRFTWQLDQVKSEELQVRAVINMACRHIIWDEGVSNTAAHTRSFYCRPALAGQ